MAQSKCEILNLIDYIVCTGRRTVCSALRAMGFCDQAGFSKFHHLLNRTQWSSLRAAKILLMIELYVDRWGIEVTFEETREHLGVKKNQKSAKIIPKIDEALVTQEV